MTSPNEEINPAPSRTRTQLARLLDWLARHPGLAVEYAQLSGDGVGLGLGADGDEALLVAVRLAEALSAPVITVTAHAGVARLAVSGVIGKWEEPPEPVHAQLAVRGAAVGALLAAQPGLQPGREVRTDLTTLRAAHSALAARVAPRPVPPAVPS